MIVKALATDQNLITLTIWVANILLAFIVFMLGFIGKYIINYMKALKATQDDFMLQMLTLRHDHNSNANSLIELRVDVTRIKETVNNHHTDIEILKTRVHP